MQIFFRMYLWIVTFCVYKIFFQFCVYSFLYYNFLSPKTDKRFDITCQYLQCKTHRPLHIIHTNQSWRITGENACYTRSECEKGYTNTTIVFSKWLLKWAKEQGFWAKLGFREWMIIIIKNVSETNISSIKSCQVACYSGKKI